VTELLTQDLQQSPFIVATSPYNSGTNGYFARMAQAGFDDGLGLPASLMRQIAREANRDYFIDGSIDHADGDYLLTARVWDATSGREAGTVEERGHDLYAVVDRLSRGVREVLDVPFEGRAAEDLELADTYGESRAALQAYIEGLNHRLLENDLAAAEEDFNRALDEDPQFVLAWLMKAVGAAESGNIPVAQQAFEEAQALDYRLPSRDRAIIKANLYWLAGETETLESFLRMQVRLNDDARSWRLLGNVLLELGKYDEARAAYQAVLERDASELDILKIMALLERGAGNVDRSIEHLREYVEERPEDVDALLQLGDMLRDAGDREGARSLYADAQFVGNRPVLPLLRLAMLDMGAGDAPSAWSLLDEARELAETPDQQSVVLSVQAMFEMRVGRIHDALRTTRAKMEQDRRFQPPVALALGGHAQLAYLHMVIGELEQARAALADAQQMLAAPMDQFLGFTEASLLAREGDLEGASEALEEGTAIVNQFQMQQMQFLVHTTRADVAHMRHDYGLAAEAMQRALDEINMSVIAGLPELAAVVPEMYGQLASYLVRSGDPAAARSPLQEGFKRDGAHPVLWLARAEHQLANGEVE
ncbi:MAG: tetratricopeptide repeat protein, partial [Xanthomonadales bacterium]|nr:tetratricopeptide repeat protein [Xanthomonadales bacterium]